MKTIKKYILFSFAKPFISSLFTLLLLMIVTHFFDYMHTFLEYKPSLLLLIRYFSSRIPEWFVTVTPIATLLGILFSLGTLNRNFEITAIKSSGIKIMYVIKPVIIFSLLVSILVGLIFGMVVPSSRSGADKLFLTIKKKNLRIDSAIRTNFIYMGANRKLYFIKKFAGNNLTGLKIIEFFPDSTKEKTLIVADKAVYSGSHWNLTNGSIRKFSPKDSSISSYIEFEHQKIYLEETPESFKKAVKKPEEMNFFSLITHIKKLERGGFSTVREKVILHHKISYPFANTVIILFGIPLALWHLMKSRTIGFFISLIICFIYWGAISVGNALGAGGILPPVVGAWSANITFFLISLVLMKLSKVI